MMALVLFLSTNLPELVVARRYGGGRGGGSFLRRPRWFGQGQNCDEETEDCGSIQVGKVLVLGVALLVMLAGCLFFGRRHLMQSRARDSNEAVGIDNAKKTLWRRKKKAVASASPNSLNNHSTVTVQGEFVPSV